MRRDAESNKRGMLIAKLAEFGEMSLRPLPDTWSAQMPAYCYTALCPDVELRQPPER